MHLKLFPPRLFDSRLLCVSINSILRRSRFSIFSKNMTIDKKMYHLSIRRIKKIKIEVDLLFTLKIPNIQKYLFSRAF